MILKIFMILRVNFIYFKLSLNHNNHRKIESYELN